MNDKNFNKSGLDLINSNTTEDEINRILFNLSDDFNRNYNSSSSSSPTILLQQQQQQQKQQNINPNNHHMTKIEFPIRSQIFRALSSSNSISLNETNINNKSTSSSISYSSSNNLLLLNRNLSSPSEYCDSSSNNNSGNETASADFNNKCLSKSKRLSANLIVTVNNKPALVTEPTGVIKDATDASRRQSWGSYSHLNPSIRNYKNNSFCTCTNNKMNSSSSISSGRYWRCLNNKTNRNLFHSNTSSSTMRSNSMLFNNNLNRTIFNRNFNKRQQQQQKQASPMSSLSSSSTSSMSSISKKETIPNKSAVKNNKQDLFDAVSCLLRIKTNKLGSSTPNLAFGICSLVKNFSIF